MLSPDQVQNISLDLPPEAQQLQNPLQAQQFENHAPLIRKEWSKADKVKAGICGFAAAVALTHMVEGMAQDTLEPVAGSDQPVAEQTVDDEDHHRHEERRAEAPDFYELVRQINEAEHSPLSSANHFRAGQYKGTRRSKRILSRHPNPQRSDSGAVI